MPVIARLASVIYRTGEMLTAVFLLAFFWHGWGMLVLAGLTFALAWVVRYVLVGETHV